MGKALRRQAGPGSADRGLAGEFGFVEKAKIARCGAIERGNAGDAPIEVGAAPRFGPGKRNDLAQSKARPPLKEERLGHATSRRRQSGKSASCRRSVW